MALFDTLAKAIETYGADQLGRRMEVQHELARIVADEGGPDARVDPAVLDFLAPLKPINPASDDRGDISKA